MQRTISMTMAIALVACGGSGGGGGENTIPLVVTNGLNGAVNVPTISVQLCVPGTTNCQTLDDILVDTGSIGLRVFSTVLDASLLASLPVTMTGGDSLTECYVYGAGYVFGTVRSADLTLGGETATNLPFQVIGDLDDVPDDCANSGQALDTPAAFSANGIIGVGLSNIDCGADCESGVSQNPIYYANGTTFTPTMVSLSQQVPNPVAKFPTDNNGVIIELPSISDAGSIEPPQGTLTFGIGTQSNNHVHGEKILRAMFNGVGLVSTTYANESYPYSFFDTGTNALLFASDLPTCSDAPTYYCPSALQHLSAMLTDADGTEAHVSFKVESADTLFVNTNATAFDDFAAVGLASAPVKMFDWGLPFFFGRRVFSAIDGATTPSGDGPYYAF